MHRVYLSVQPDNLPSSATRFFTEWKERGKEIERLRERLAELEAKTAEPEMIGGIPVLVTAHRSRAEGPGGPRCKDL